MTTNKHILALLILTTTLIVGCKKDSDFPPVKELPEGNIITIDSARNIYTAFDTTILDDVSIYGIVTADESTGNIYKELFIQDETNAIKLGLLSSSDYFIGDRIRVSIKGGTITRDNNMILIDNIDPDLSIVKQASNLDLTPEVVTLTDIAISGLYSPYQAKLIQINNVEFICADVCETWANAITQSDENRMLTDTLGNQIIVRSSGYSSFAGQSLPLNQGSIIAVVSRYSNDLQLTIRNPNELTMFNTRKTACPTCPTYLHTQSWNANDITANGWTTQYPVTNNLWSTDDFPGTDYYAVVDNTTSQLVGESWLISPAFDLSTTNTPQFNFSTAARSGTSAGSLQIMISTNYDGASLPSTATWTDITNVNPFSLSTGSWSWTNSGNFNLSAYKVPGVHIAFKYTSTGVNRDTWEMDNFNLIDF